MYVLSVSEDLKTRTAIILVKSYAVPAAAAPGEGAGRDTTEHHSEAAECSGMDDVMGPFHIFL